MNYPNKKKTFEKVVSTSKLGMTLESDINLTNAYYLDKKIAVIHKKPTPVQVVKVSYPSRNKAKIVEAYYKTPSTTDYNGIYKGYYLDFDCKETNQKTSLPLANIHKHQQHHLKDVHDQGGIAFLIVHFKRHQKYFLMPYLSLKPYFDEEITRKSIPYEAFVQKGYEIPFGLLPRLDYLKLIDQMISFESPDDK
jgi:recombination protein U